MAVSTIGVQYVVKLCLVNNGLFEHTQKHMFEHIQRRRGGGSKNKGKKEETA